MPKSKHSESVPLRPKIFGSPSEISQGIEKLRSRIVQAEELKKDGLPYRDALKVTTEYQLRDTIREVFGSHSPEFHDHQHHRIKVSSKAGIDETITLLQNLVLSLEEKRLHLLGLRPMTHPTANTSDRSAVDSPVTEVSQTSGTPAPAPATLYPTSHDISVPVKPANSPHKPSMKPSSSPASDVNSPGEPAPANPHLPKASKPSASHFPASQSRHRMKLSAEVRMQETTSVTHTIETPSVSLAENMSTSAPAPAGEPTPTHASKPASPEESCLPSVASPDPVVLEDPASHTQNKDEVSMSPVQTPNSNLQQVDSDPLGVIRKVCSRFHSVVRQLRQRRDDRSTLEVEDETDVQDVLQTLLCSQFDDVQTEAWTPSYANGTPRTDLVVKQDGIVVVVKKTRQGISGKTLADQLGVDIARYLGHPSCKTLMCFIYDPEGRIGNPGALEAALTGQQNGRRIEVLISPK